MIRALLKFGRKFKLLCFRRFESSFSNVWVVLQPQECKDFGKEILVSPVELLNFCKDKDSECSSSPVKTHWAVLGGSKDLGLNPQSFALRGQ